ncbi:uncharacterized protein LOC133496010 [Syngnathoides biaculeatus]|uniref:uncharacterized protein LOC133495760 n=1 Tax=Syngnathoides biaculeatus TaxID=300417 RepID=UPI002ADDC503|nr:uncharacterized protein LOC133495760 [Syngnathoides biaculeatus]XP_061666790.1 uncharacterized protein LOC133495828 [Syngnathoides biaculeatus]XP_061667104.1 uncharacterized protein LOC133496010 [Syngnathoides biaculeatus]
MAGVWLLVLLLCAVFMDNGLCIPAGEEQRESNVVLKKDVSPDYISLQRLVKLLDSLDSTLKLHTPAQPATKEVFQDKASYHERNDQQSHNVSGKGQLNDAVSHNVSGKGQLNDAVSHNVSGKGQLNDAVSHNVSGKGQLNDAVSHNVSGKGQLNDAVSHNVSGKGQLNDAVSHNVSGKGQLNDIFQEVQEGVNQNNTMSHTQQSESLQVQSVTQNNRLEYDSADGGIIVNI